MVSSRRPTGLWLPLLLGLSLVGWTGQVQGQDKKDQPEVKRKAKRVKALSLAAQSHIIRVTRVLEKYSKLGDEAETIRANAKQAAKDIAEWEKQLKDPEIKDKAVEKLNSSIASARQLMASAPKEIERLEASARQQIAKTLPVLDKMREVSNKLQSQDKAAMWNYYGYVYAILEKYMQARDAYESMLGESELADNLRLQALYSSGQLSMLLEEFARGVKRLEEWYAFTVELGRPIRPGDHFLLAQGYYSLKRYKDVISRIEQAMGLAGELGQPVRENWLRLLVATHFTREDFASARPGLELLVLMFPKREYWLQLQGTYGELELQESQLAILDLAWRQGLLEKQSEFVSLAQHLQFANDPLQAALVLEEGIEKEIVKPTYDNLKMVANFWQRAQEVEKALNWYRKADEQSDTGEAQYRIALLLNLENRIEEFLNAARKAYEKGNFPARQETRVLIGQALLELGQLEEALEIFREIAEDGQEDKVTIWIDYAERQLESRKAIQDTIDLYKKQEKEILARLEK